MFHDRQHRLCPTQGLDLGQGQRRRLRRYQPADRRATHEKELPVGKHPLQLYSLGTPNGQKVTILWRSCWRSAMAAPNMTPG